MDFLTHTNQWWKSLKKWCSTSTRTGMLNPAVMQLFFFAHVYLIWIYCSSCCNDACFGLHHSFHYISRKRSTWNLSNASIWWRKPLPSFVLKWKKHCEKFATLVSAVIEVQRLQYTLFEHAHHQWPRNIQDGVVFKITALQKEAYRVPRMHCFFWTKDQAKAFYTRSVWRWAHNFVKRRTKGKTIEVASRL